NQVRALAQGVDVIVATPGRLIDLMDEGRARLDGLEVLILDEADRMLDMGFIRDIRKIAAVTPKTRRTALFSATMPAEIDTLAQELLREPVRVEIARSGESVQAIEQRVDFVQGGYKRQHMAKLLADPAMARVIVFARTKRGCDRVAKNLEIDGFRAEAIHGDKAQNARQRALDAFKRGHARVLVATDIAARGIDVEGVTHVVQFELPDEPESYTHRIGRTGRNGATGIAITLCDETERDKLAAVEKLIRRAFRPDGTLSDEPPAPPARGQKAPGSKAMRRGRSRRPAGRAAA
ncbi:MAG: RNA helicase, partial [Rhodobacterales bacterium CG18_big_fil_WC_8_21_14_2_50_71_9]